MDLSRNRRDRPMHFLEVGRTRSWTSLWWRFNTSGRDGNSERWVALVDGQGSHSAKTIHDAQLPRFQAGEVNSSSARCDDVLDGSNDRSSRVGTWSSMGRDLLGSKLGNNRKGSLERLRSVSAHWE